MHGRTRLLALALVAACWLPAAAAAAPMPAGTYGVNIGSGTIDIGTGFLPPLALNSGTSFTVPIGTTPVAQPIGLTIPDAPISGSLTGTVSVTVTGAGVTIDPANGSATLDAGFYVSATINGLGTCSLGSSGAPIQVHLTTANGAAWDSATGAFSMADKTFVLPAPSCSPSLLAGLLGTYLGSIGTPGNNVISIAGTALRQADPVTTPVTTPTTSAGSTPSGVTNVPLTTTDGTPQPQPPAAVRRCVVPKLVGKTLKQAKRALTKAGCKAGKARSKKSKKKKGRIFKQGKKAGTSLPFGTKIPLSVSRGPKNARTRRSR